MVIHDSADPVSNSSTETHTEARQAAYVAFLHRVPFAIDALTLGFLPGFREDCSYQQSQFDTLECPVGMLDNDFRNPNLDWYADRALEYEPDVGIIGDFEWRRVDQLAADHSTDELQERVRELTTTITDYEREYDAATPADVDAVAVAETRDERTIAEVYADLTDWATARQERTRVERARQQRVGTDQEQASS